MKLPGLKFHQLKGDLAGFYSASVSGNWRVIFHFENGQAMDVDLIDSHSGVMNYEYEEPSTSRRNNTGSVHHPPLLA